MGRAHAMGQGVLAASRQAGRLGWGCAGRFVNGQVDTSRKMGRSTPCRLRWLLRGTPCAKGSGRSNTSVVHHTRRAQIEGRDLVGCRADQVPPKPERRLIPTVNDEIDGFAATIKRKHCSSTAGKPQAKKKPKSSHKQTILSAAEWFLRPTPALARAVSAC